MTYTIIANPEVEATFWKMGKKDAARFEQIIKKLEELGENPESESRFTGQCRDCGACISGTMS